MTRISQHHISHLRPGRASSLAALAAVTCLLLTLAIGAAPASALLMTPDTGSPPATTYNVEICGSSNVNEIFNEATPYYLQADDNEPNVDTTPADGCGAPTNTDSSWFYEFFNTWPETLDVADSQGSSATLGGDVGGSAIGAANLYPTSMTVTDGGYIGNGGWEVQQSQGGWSDPFVYEDCTDSEPEGINVSDCADGDGGFYNGVEQYESGPVTETLPVDTTYVEMNDPSSSLGDGYVAADLVTLSYTDPQSAPTLGALSGSMSSDFSGWVGGVGEQTLDYSASDPAGVCELEAQLVNSAGTVVQNTPVTGLSVPTQNSDGSLTYPTCSTGTVDGSLTYDLNSLATGEYTVNIVGENPANLSNYEPQTLASETLEVDNTTPSITVDVPASGHWYTSDQSVTVSATGGQSGLASVTCTDNGSNVTATSTTAGTDSETATFPVAVNGVNDLACSATGANGLVGSGDATVEIDTTPPSVSFSGATVNQWVASAQTLTATAVVGPSGLDGGIQCRPSSGGAEQNFPSGTGAVTVGGSGQGSGVYTITCTVENNAGVTANITSGPIEVDEQQPTVAFSGVDGSTTAAGDAVALSSGGTLTVSGTDPAPAGDSSWAGGSGIQSVSCQVNGDGYATAAGDSYSLPVSGSGDYQVDCRATNGVGTVGATSSYYVDIDTATTGDGQSAIVNAGQSAYSNGPSETQWHRDAQTLTVSATLPNGDPVASIACTGAGVNDNDPNTSGTPSETVGVNVSAPGGTLVCTATDTSGNTYPLGSYVVNIDDTPPTGYFVGADAPSPALIRAAVADDQSGVASVTINVLCLSGACLDAVQAGSQPASTALPTAYNPADGYWEATIPDDGSLADGDYELIANTTDVAGNTGQVTEFPDGSTAGISLPARIVTVLDLTAAAGDDETPATTMSDTGVPTATADTARAVHGSSTSDASTGSPAGDTSDEVCTVKTVVVKKATKTHKAKTKLKRVCMKLKKVKSLTLKYGQKSTLSGVLVSQAGDSPIADAQLVVQEIVSGQSTPTTLATVTTNGSGEFKYTAKPGPSRVLEVLYDGTPILRSAAAKVTERSHGTSTLTAPERLTAGGTATLSGTVKGGYIPPGGVQVQLWYTIKGSHVAFAPWTTTIHTTSKGKWKFTFRLASYTAGTTYEFQARLDHQYGWGYLEGDSKILTRTIR